MNTPAPPPVRRTSDPASPANDTTPATYRVFLSYSHSDTKWATWLMRRLENYRVAPRWQGRLAPIGEVGPRIAPVFRDRDELPTSPDLGDTIRRALAASETLVAICSPAAAASRWVEAEIMTFKQLRGDARVFAFIVDGQPEAGAPDDCFPSALRIAVGPDGAPTGQHAEIIAADAREHADGREAAFVRLVAGLLGVSFDDLRRRELQRRHRRMTIIAASSALGMGLTLSLAVIAWRARTEAWQARNEAVEARNDAQRRQDQAEDLLRFMVSDLRAPLAKLNRLEILDAVGEKALAYFAQANPRDLTDAALQRQVEALRQIGENRKDQARFPEALQALQTAYERANVLALRNPSDGETLFQRGQAEYWIGWVLRRLGRTPEAVGWFKRYRDTGAALVALAPDDPRWQEEQALGHHNLAVLELEEERIAAARKGFRGALVMLEQLAAAKPDDTELRYRIADTNSWLGTAAELEGDLGEAEARYAAMVASTEALYRGEPSNPTAKRRFADALSLHSGILAITGQRARATELRLRAVGLLESLAAGDPKNQSWQRLLLWWRLRVVELLRAQGDTSTAVKLARETREKLEAGAISEPSDPRLPDRLVFACRLEAELLAADQPEAAARLAQRAVEIADGFTAGRRNPAIVGEFALAHLTAGRIAQQRGDGIAASGHWQRALDLLEPRLNGSRHWRLLLPAAFAHHLAGQTARSRELITQLEEIGFQPLEPWPSAPSATRPLP